MEIKLLKCSVIMLPTEDVAKLGSLAIGKFKGLFQYKSKREIEEYMDNIRNEDKPQHLYLGSSCSEIKEGDWVINLHVKNCIWQADEDAVFWHTFGAPDPKWLKVEATTDKSLNLPSIPQSFIEEYVSKQGEIKEIVLELVEKCVFDFTARCTQGNCSCNFIPKIENGGNVIIHSIEPAKQK